MELFSTIMFFAAMYAWDKDVELVHIKNHEVTPYCETTEVAGKKITRCLKAVEVPAPVDSNEKK